MTRLATIIAVFAVLAAAPAHAQDGHRRGPPGGFGRPASAVRPEWGPPRGAPGWGGRPSSGPWPSYGPAPRYGAPVPRGWTGRAPGWRSGQRLPPNLGGYVEDWGRLHLRRPPYGYHWFAAGDQYMLVSDSTGLIFDVVRGGY